MRIELTDCVKLDVEDRYPTFLLSWTSELMRLYPWMLRIGLVLQRLVQ